MLAEWEFKGGHVIVDRPEYRCELEEFRRGEEQMVFIHMDVHDWSKRALKFMRDDFNLLRQHVTCPLFACGENDDKKWAQYVKFFGFKFLSNAVCTDGKPRRIFVHFKE